MVKTGPGAERLKPGDRVALEPGIPCGKCEFCKSGHYNLCPDVQFLATPPVQGCYEEYIAFPEDMCFLLPENVSTLEGALIEPLSVGFYAADQEAWAWATPQLFSEAAVSACDAAGCKARGAGKIIVADLVDARLEKARELGADHVINSGKMDIIEAIGSITGGRGGDVVFETAGAPATIAQTPFAVRRGGRIVLVGMSSQPEINYNFAQIMDKEAEIKSVFRYRNMYPKAIGSGRRRRRGCEESRDSSVRSGARSGSFR